MPSDTVEIRFKLYRKSDRRLLDRIAELADGANQNIAARFLLRYWFENERQSFSPQLGQSCLPQLGQNDTVSGTPEDELEAVAKDIEGFW